MRLSRDIAAEEQARAGQLYGFALYIDDPSDAELRPQPKLRFKPTRTGRCPRAALSDARALAQQWGECWVCELRYDDRGRHIVTTTIKKATR